jgi:cytochrome c biogenesis protein CcmG/thiol:disulfide interchange protein DsbE
VKVAAAAAAGLILLLSGCGSSATHVRADGVPKGAGQAAATPTPSGPLPDLCPPVGSRIRASQDVLPDITLNCLGSDDRRSLRDLGGRPMVLNFWASWCGPCKVELPLLARAHRAHGRTISFVGVDVQDASAEAWKILTTAGVGYPQLEDPRGVTRAAFRWNGGLPITVFIDMQGRMVATERTSFRTYAEVTAALNRHLGIATKDVDR